MVGQARGLQAVALGHLGRFDEAHAVLAPALATDGELGVAAATWRGVLRFVCDDLTGAVADLAAAGPAAERRGLHNLAAIAYTHLARAEYTAGAWDDAVVHAGRATAIALAHEHLLPAFVWGGAISVPAARGDWALADSLAQEASRTVLECADRVAWLGVTRALPAAARGDAHAVLAALAPLLQIHPRDALEEPGFWPWHDLHGAALVAARRLEEADAFLCRREAIAAARDRSSAIARLARVRGSLEAARGEAARAEAAFELALERAGAVPIPYDVALTRLAYGAFLRRAGRRRTAAEQLGQARAALASLGARPLRARARGVRACSRQAHARGSERALPAGTLDRAARGERAQQPRGRRRARRERQDRRVPPAADLRETRRALALGAGGALRGLGRARGLSAPLPQLRPGARRPARSSPEPPALSAAPARPV